MPCAHNAAFEQGKGRFHCVGMNVSMGIVLRVVNRAVEVLLHFVERPRINSRLVGDNHFDMAPDVRLDNLADSRGLRILGMNQPEIAVALPDADDNLLFGTVAPLAGLSPNVSLVNLNRAAQFLRSGLKHGSPDAVREVPRGFIGRLEHPAQLVRRHALARLTEQVGSEKPLPEGQVGIVEDRPRRGRELVTASIAIKLVASRYAGNLIRTARWAVDTLWPAQLFEVSPALFFAAEVLNQSAEV